MEKVLCSTWINKALKSYKNKESKNYIKINPKPIHSDPAGIYMFPEDALNAIKGVWKKRKFCFIIKLKSNLNILNLLKYYH